VRLFPQRLGEPLRWRRPQRVAVGLMGDLGHERLSDGARLAVWATFAASWALDRGHTFLVLTKRPGVLCRWLAELNPRHLLDRLMDAGTYGNLADALDPIDRLPWPLPNVHVGVSVEDQASADERLPWLLDPAVPIALRWASYEPALGPVDLRRVTVLPARPPHDPAATLDALAGVLHGPEEGRPRLSWVVAGGESGPGARPCDVAWLRDAVRQCRHAEVPVFVKQLGARPIVSPEELAARGRGGMVVDDEGRGCLRHPKGADPAEWPEDLRVQQLPGEVSNRLRKRAGERRQDGQLAANQHRMGPLTLDARREALARVLAIQGEVNAEAARLGRPAVDLLNPEEHTRIVELIDAGTWPNKWTGDEPLGDELFDEHYADGSMQPLLEGLHA
jgi:protein gp37